MPDILAPAPVFRQWDNNGNPLVAGQLFTYVAGTNIPQATYTDSTGSQANSNPIVLNSRGEANVWIPPNTAYKFVLEDSLGNAIWSVDQIINNQLLSLYGGVDAGAANAYLLSFTAAFTAYTNGIVLYWTPANTNTGASTINVNGIGSSSLVNLDGSPLQAGQIVAGQTAGVIYNNGAFQLLLTGTNPLVLPFFTKLTPGTTVPDAGGAQQSVGYLLLPPNILGAGGYSTIASDSGKYLINNTGSTNTFIINDATVNYPLGTAMVFSNPPGSGALSITLQTTPANLSWWPSGATGVRTLTSPGECTAVKYGAGAPGAWRLIGTNLS